MTVNFTNNNNITQYLLNYNNVNEFLCIIYNTTDNIEVPKMNSSIPRKEIEFKNFNYKIESGDNQIIMHVDLEPYTHYTVEKSINYTLNFTQKSNNYICIYSNGSKLNLTKLDKFSEYCLREKSTIKKVDLLYYMNLYNESKLRNTDNKIEGMNYNITLNYTTIIINYVNYEIVYNKTKYINLLECVCTKEKILSTGSNEYLTAIICTNTSLKCVLLKDSIRLIQKKLSYILVWHNTSLYYYYSFKDNKTDFYQENKYYTGVILNYLDQNYFNKSSSLEEKINKRSLLEETINKFDKRSLLEEKNNKSSLLEETINKSSLLKEKNNKSSLLEKTINKINKRNKRSILEGHFYDFYINLKKSIYYIWKDISNTLTDIYDSSKEENYIHIVTKHILNAYETLPDMYDLNNNQIKIKVKNYDLSDNLLELPNNINSTSLRMSDVKSILLMIIIILTFLIMTLPLCCI
jgi:hypothetical protein